MTEPAVLKAVLEVVNRVNDAWWTLPEREVVPHKVLERIDEHIRAVTPVLKTCAG